MLGKLLDMLLGKKIDVGLEGVERISEDAFFGGSCLQCPLCGSTGRFYLSMMLAVSVRGNKFEYLVKEPAIEDVKRCVCDTCRHEAPYETFLSTTR